MQRSDVSLKVFFMGLRGESASEIKCDFATKLSQAPVSLDLIHSL